MQRLTTLCLICSFVLGQPSLLLAQTRNNLERASALPEFGTLVEIANAQSVYVYANDLEARNIIVKELSKTSLRIADTPERADFLLLYGVESEVTGRSYHSASSYSYGSASYFGLGMINKDHIGDMAAVVRGQAVDGKPRPRILWTTRKVRSYSSGITLNRNPATNGTREFLKEWEKVQAHGPAVNQPLKQSSIATPSPLPASKSQAMTNTDILLLVTAGFSPELIVAKIRSTPSSFDTSINALQELKAASVPEAVIMAMMEGIKPAPAPTAVAPMSEQAPVTQRQAPQSLDRIVVPGGTRVLLELAFTVTSDQMNPGDTLSFTTVHAVEVEGYVVIRRGAIATGRIVKSEGGKSWGRGGNIAWQISDVMTPDGTSIPLQFASMTTKGDGKGGEMATGMILTGILAAPVFVPLWGFKKGKAAVIPAGKRFETIVPQDVNLDYIPKLRSGDPRAYQEPVRLPGMLNRSAKEINESKTIFRRN